MANLKKIFAIREEVGDDAPISISLSPGEWEDLETFLFEFVNEPGGRGDYARKFYKIISQTLGR